MSPFLAPFAPNDPFAPKEFERSEFRLSFYVFHEAKMELHHLYRL